MQPNERGRCEISVSKYLHEFKEYSLTEWAEVGAYVRGKSDDSGIKKTFRKDKILKYLDGSEDLLAEPLVQGPPLIPRRSPPSIPRRSLDAISAPRHAKPPEGVPTILFTGFTAQQRAEFEAVAKQVNLFVCQSVIKGLNFLCTGPNAGPAKIEKARQQGTYIISQAHSHAFIESGVLPDED